MNKRQKKKQIKNKNKKLIEKYPFLLPRNVWTGKPLKGYNYMHTELDCMPEGWNKAFGEMMCEEIKEILVEKNMLHEYKISQIKEKYGQLRWYDFGCVEEIHDIIHKYEYLSERTCVCCGKFDVSLFDDGWLSPYCDKCFLEVYKRKERNIAKYSKEELVLPPDEEILKEYRLEDEPLRYELNIEIMSKEGCRHKKIPLTNTINKLKKG